MSEPIVRREVPPQFPRSKVKLFIVGEAPNEDEALAGNPFVGSAGRLLDRLLIESGVKREDCYMGNVFRQRPPDNKMDWFFMGKRDAKTSGWDMKCEYPVNQSGYVKPEFVSHLEQLQKDIRDQAPEVILALGNIALWALTGTSGIGTYRGAAMDCTLVRGPKVIASFHPSTILRSWDNLPTLFSDIQKVLNWSNEQPKRTLLIYPTLDDLSAWYDKHIASQSAADKLEHPVSFDIETANDQITCVGFSHRGEAIVVPFWSARADNRSYWPTEDHEKQAWEFIASILCDPTVGKVAQNGNYDVQWLSERAAIKLQGPLDDTMYMSHALQPEMRKGLGYLVSLHLKAPAWKNMVSHSKTSGNKADA